MKTIGLSKFTVTVLKPVLALVGLFLMTPPIASQEDFRRGDANADGLIDISDVNCVARFMFAATSLNCRAAADANDDGKHDVTDLWVLFDSLFVGGAPLPPPGPDLPGPDPTPDEMMTCLSYQPATPVEIARFALGFAGAPQLVERSGNTSKYEILATLTTSENNTQTGAEGWSFGMGVEDLEILSIEYAGQVTADLLSSEVLDPSLGGGAVSGALLDQQAHRTLAREGTAPVAVVTLEATIPSGEIKTGRLFFDNGLRGAEQPVTNVVALQGIHHAPLLGSIVVSINDCNVNSIPDDQDIATGQSLDENRNGFPDECEEADCNRNGIPDEIEEGDCDGDGKLDECEYAAGAAPDCYVPVVNLGLVAASGGLQISDDWLVFEVKESSQGDRDLNGDGDTNDTVYHVRDLAGQSTANTRLTAADPPLVLGKSLFLLVDEPSQGATDLNGDGDSNDRVFHAFNLEEDAVTNFELAAMAPLLAAGNRIAFMLCESDQNFDLNDNGNTDECFLHIHDIESHEVHPILLDTAPEAYLYGVSDNWLVFVVRESRGAGDLNGDGDQEDLVFHVHDLATRRTINTLLEDQGGQRFVCGDKLVVSAYEYSQNTDFNGDGDTDDYVLTVYDLRSETTTNVGLATSGFEAAGHWVAFWVNETEQDGQDLNGDEDSSDDVLHVIDLRSGTTTNVALAQEAFVQTYVFFDAAGTWMAFWVNEAAQGGEDLNGDGDSSDDVLHVLDLERGRASNLNFVANWQWVSVVERWLTFAVDENEQGGDLNGDGDSLDIVFHVWDLEGGELRNVGLATGSDYVVSSKRVAFSVGEPSQGGPTSTAMAIRSTGSCSCMILKAAIPGMSASPRARALFAGKPLPSGCRKHGKPRRISTATAMSGTACSTSISRRG